MRLFGPSLVLRLESVVLVAALLTFGAPARAQRHGPSPPGPRSGTPAADVQAEQAPTEPPHRQGAAALERARAAWDKADYDVAEPLFHEAIETGGLEPQELLDAYVRLGAVCTILGKKTAAASAFKAAARIDPHFVLPPEAGKRSAAIADRARRAEARRGTISLKATMPTEVTSGDSPQVDATLDAAHVPVTSKIAVSARDPLSGKSYFEAQEPATTAHFSLPSSLTLPDASLQIRVDALDAHQNRLASFEGRTHVKAAEGAAAAIALGPILGGPAASNAKSDSDKDNKKKGGFWTSAWPYVIGGVALAAGGAAIFLATRSSDDVNVGAVHVALTR